MRITLSLVLGLFVTACQTNSNIKPEQKQLIETYTQLATSYLEQNRTGVALERSARAVSLAPNNVKTNYVYGLAQQQNKNYPVASKFLKKSFNLSQGKYLAAKNAYAVVLCRQGMIAKGRKLLQELINDDKYSTPSFARKNLKQCYK